MSGFTARELCSMVNETISRVESRLGPWLGGEDGVGSECLNAERTLPPQHPWIQGAKTVAAPQDPLGFKERLRAQKDQSVASTS